MAARELDRLGFGSRGHEALEVRVDHAILLGHHRIAGFL
jgi:hypothetical protein